MSHGTFPKFVVLGAGSIGCYVGGALAAGGADVVFLARPHIAHELAAHGLRITDYGGRDRRIVPNVTTDSASLAKADVILVTVKSGATRRAAHDLASHASKGALVISLQNGIANAQELAAALPHQTVLAGMVPFNVAHLAPGHWHQGTQGQLHVAAHPRIEPLTSVFADAGLPLVLPHDMVAVQWGKLLMNLNNAVNALSGQALVSQLADRNYRRVLAASISEALTVLDAANIAPAKAAGIAPRLLPRLLNTPNWLYRRLAKRQLAMDPLARSSMADDLAQCRATEVDVLNGEIVRLGARVGRPTPVNAALTALVHQAEAGQIGKLAGADLVARLGL
jgi:2-dehydropantoate 2-reductase